MINGSFNNKNFPFNNKNTVTDCDFYRNKERTPTKQNLDMITKMKYMMNAKPY